MEQINVGGFLVHSANVGTIHVSNFMNPNHDTPNTQSRPTSCKTEDYFLSCLQFCHAYNLISCVTANVGRWNIFILCCWCFRACLTFESVLLFSVCKTSRDIRRELWWCMELFGFPWSFSSIVDMWSHKHSTCNSTKRRCNLPLKSGCKLYHIAVLLGETPLKDGWNENIALLCNWLTL